MLIALESDLVESLSHTLKAATEQLARADEREDRLRKQLENSLLLSESEAQAYLRHDADTVRYYRTLGLVSYKKGKYRWYRKGDIDDWLATGRISRHNR